MANMVSIRSLTCMLNDPAKYHQAMELLSQMVVAGQYPDWALANICILYDRLGDSENLKIYLRTPSTLSSSRFDIWFSFGCLHLKLNRFEDAIECLQVAHYLKQEDTNVLLRLGYCYEGLKRFDEAIGVVEKAIDIV